MDFLTRLKNWVEARFPEGLPTPGTQASYDLLQTDPENETYQDMFVGVLGAELGINLSSDLTWKNIERRFAASANASEKNIENSEAVGEIAHAPVIGAILPAYANTLAQTLQAVPESNGKHPQEIVPREWQAFITEPSGKTFNDLFEALQPYYLDDVFSHLITVDLTENLDLFPLKSVIESLIFRHNAASVFDDAPRNQVRHTDLSTFAVRLFKIVDGLRKNHLRLPSTEQEGAPFIHIMDLDEAALQNGIRWSLQKPLRAAESWIADRPWITPGNIYIFSLAAYYEQLVRFGDEEALQQAMRIRDLFAQPEQLAKFVFRVSAEDCEPMKLSEALQIISGDEVNTVRVLIKGTIQSFPLSTTTAEIAKARAVFPSIAEVAAAQRQEAALMDACKELLAQILQNPKLLQQMAQYRQLVEAEQFWHSADFEGTVENKKDKLSAAIDNAIDKLRNKVFSASGKETADVIYDYVLQLLHAGHVREFLRINEATSGWLSDTIDYSGAAVAASEVQITNDFTETVTVFVPSEVAATLSGKSVREIEIAYSIQSPLLDEAQAAERVNARLAREAAMSSEAGARLTQRALRSSDPSSTLSKFLLNREQATAVGRYFVHLLSEGKLAVYLQIQYSLDSNAVESFLKAGEEKPTYVSVSDEIGQETILIVPEKMAEEFAGKALSELEGRSFPGEGLVFAPEDTRDQTNANIDRAKNPGGPDLDNPDNKPEDGSEGYAATDDEPTLPKAIGGDKVALKLPPLPGREINDDVQELMENGRLTHRGLLQLQNVLNKNSQQPLALPNANGAVAVLAGAQAANEAAAASAAIARFTKALEVFFVLAR